MIFSEIRTDFFIISFLLSLSLCLAWTDFAAAQDFPSEPVGHVNDFANLLTESERQQLDTKLRTYRDTTTTVLAIATLPDLQGYSIEEVGTQLFNEWQMWEDERYNGALIVIAPNERKIRIEVGYGLEGAIPDILAGRIIRNILTPSFRQGDFYGGLDEATTVMIQLARGEYEGDLSESRTAEDDSDISSFIVFLLFLAYVIYVSSRRGGGRNGKRRRRTLGPGGFIFMGGGHSGSGGFGGGGGFGGFSGGGGFGSGGGGASGGW